jgi:hypothetical protein
MAVRVHDELLPPPLCISATSKTRHVDTCTPTVRRRASLPRNPAPHYALSEESNLLIPALVRMPTLDRNVAEQIADSSLEYTFRNVYRFILGAVGGDAAVAKAMFERYLAGELSEELLTVSRQCVRADRKGARVEQDWANKESKAAAMAE